MSLSSKTSQYYSCDYSLTVAELCWF